MRGFSLAELAVALGTLAVMAGTVTAAVSATLDRGRLARATREVDALARAAERYPAAAGRVDYDGLSLGALEALGLVPATLGRHAWGGPVEVCSRGGGCAAFNADPLRFAVVLAQVPAASAPALCAPFAGRADCSVAGTGAAATVRVLF
jgi:hypothetical protein